jgi:hypothetical protein
MIVSDFLKILKVDFQEKNADKEFWDNPQLLIKIIRAYNKIQNDVPYFISRENLFIKEDITQYHLKHKALEDNSLKIEKSFYKFCESEDFYLYEGQAFYTLEKEILTLTKTPIKDSTARISYKYAKEIKSENCEIELPSKYNEALRTLTLSYIYEKSKGNSKERDLSVHYLKRYQSEKLILKRSKKYTKNITSNFQII